MHIGGQQTKVICIDGSSQLAQNFGHKDQNVRLMLATLIIKWSNQEMWTVRIVHKNNKNIPPRVTTRQINRLDDLKQTVEDAVKIDEVELIELSAYDQWRMKNEA